MEFIIDVLGINNSPTLFIIRGLTPMLLVMVLMMYLFLKQEMRKDQKTLEGSKDAMLPPFKLHVSVYIPYEPREALGCAISADGVKCLIAKAKQLGAKQLELYDSVGERVNGTYDINDNTWATVRKQLTSW